MPLIKLAAFYNTTVRLRRKTERENMKGYLSTSTFLQDMMPLFFLFVWSR